MDKSYEDLVEALKRQQEMSERLATEAVNDVMGHHERRSVEALEHLCVCPGMRDSEVTRAMIALFGHDPLTERAKTLVSASPRLAAFCQRTGEHELREEYAKKLKASKQRREEASREQHDASPDICCLCDGCGFDRAHAGHG